MAKDNVLGIILAREGSKRLPGKNKESLGSMSLVDLVMKKAKGAGITTVAICTDYTFFMVAPVDGCEMIRVCRPPELSGDDVPSEDVIEHVLSYVKSQGHNFEYLCLMQLTAPLFHTKTLRQVVEDVVDHAVVGCASITPAYKPAGCFYMVRIADFLESGANNLWPEGMIMMKLGWHECVDIDHVYDLRIAQAVANGDVFEEGS